METHAAAGELSLPADLQSIGKLLAKREIASVTWKSVAAGDAKDSGESQCGRSAA